MYKVVGSDGLEYGPADINTLREWISQGRLLPSTVVVDTVSGHRSLATDFPLIADLFVSAGVSSQQPPQQPPAASYGASYGANYVAPNYYQRPPQSGVSPRSKIAAGLLALFLGGIGIHQFYLGKTGLGLAMLLLCVLTCGWGGIITGIWALVDAIILLTGSGKDVEGRPVVD